MNERVLLVDDDVDIISAFSRNLRNEFKITTATSAYEAFDIINNSQPFAVIISDYKMPKMNGVEFLSTIKSLHPDTVRVILTGYADLDASIKAINDGFVFRFLTKPIETSMLINTIKDCLEQHRLITAEKELLDQTLRGTIKLLIDILTAINPKMFKLATMMRGTARDIANQLNLKNTWEIEISALLSHIGCISIPDDILERFFENKELSQEEISLLNLHPIHGYNFLKNIPRLKNIAESIKYQFYNYDGSNAQELEVKGDKIPLISRILKVVYDFNNLLQQGLDNALAIDKMFENSFKYDNAFLNTLMEVNKLKSKGFIIKSIPFKQLRIGMLLAENLRDEEGMILIPKGHEVTDVALMRLITITRHKKVHEPIKIIEMESVIK